MQELYKLFYDKVYDDPRENRNKQAKGQVDKMLTTLRQQVAAHPEL
jgi:hypothetical protein